MKKKCYLFLLLIAVLSIGNGTTMAKVLKGKCKVESGKASGLDSIQQKTEEINTSISDNRYQEILDNPAKAKNDTEALAVLQAREIFLLVDQSGSMGNDDQDPRTDHMTHKTYGVLQLQPQSQWKLWDSARVAAEGLAEVALTLDRNSEVPIYFFQNSFFKKEKVYSVTAKSVTDVSNAFINRTPEGGTPLAEALQEVYREHLKELLNKGESFTVITLTDGVPDDQGAVEEFFKMIVKNHRLKEKSRRHLAAFSFIQMGDDDNAEKFLERLDDKLEKIIGVDIIDYKKDNYIFGTDPKYRDDCGPLAVFRDAVFD